MTKMRWNCSTQGCRLECRWNPDCLDGLLPRKSSFGDMDAWAEISGHFLFVEQKGSRDRQLSMGQWNGLKRLAWVPYCTVWYIKDRPEGGYFFKDMRYPDAPVIPVTHDDFCDMVATWGEWAAERPVKQRTTRTKRMEAVR